MRAAPSHKILGCFTRAAREHKTEGPKTWRKADEVHRTLAVGWPNFFSTSLWFWEIRAVVKEPSKKKTLDTRHMVKIQTGSPEVEHFGKLRQTHVFRTRIINRVLTNFSSW